MMKFKRFEIWTADLNPRMGTEAGKTRPVVIIQTDLLNNIHPSTIICPLTTQVQHKAEILRIHLKKGDAGIKKASDIMIDQVRAIDNRRFLKRIGMLNSEIREELQNNLKTILDLD